MLLLRNKIFCLGGEGEGGGLRTLRLVKIMFFLSSRILFQTYIIYPSIIIPDYNKLQQNFKKSTFDFSKNSLNRNKIWDTLNSENRTYS